jgi:hypothetical protein
MSLIKPIVFKLKGTNTQDKNSAKLTEQDCLTFVKYIKDKILTTKTSTELKNLKFVNPITKQKIGISSPILQSFLSKCYTSFTNQEVKDIIDEITNISDLMNAVAAPAPKTPKPAAAPKPSKQPKPPKPAAAAAPKPPKPPKTQKPSKTAKPIIDNTSFVIGEAIDNAIKHFYKCCDELEANCNATGILKEHLLITNVVNSIMTIIHIKYMHLNNLYSNLVIKDKQPLQIYMYDEKFHNYLSEKQLNVRETFVYHYNLRKKIVYQDVDTDILVDAQNLKPNNVDTYYLNTLYNRQYVFEYPRRLLLKTPTASNPTPIDQYSLYFNKNNSIILDMEAFPKSLETAKEAFKSDAATKYYFDYNITNCVLPQYIFINDNTALHNYFTGIITLVNDRIKKFPVITGIATEYTMKKDYYNKVIENMRDNSYGNNETGYGGNDMIRKNILYSMNAYITSALTNNIKQIPTIYDENYYNYEFSGTFPLFTWIPIIPADADRNPIYNYSNSDKWQPFKLATSNVKLIEENYKDYNRGALSKGLNIVVSKAITEKNFNTDMLYFNAKKYTHIKITPAEHQEKIQEMIMRIKNTIGMYKDKTINPSYSNNTIYLYHGCLNRKHNITGKYNEDIELLSFLSTSVSAHVAITYSEYKGIVYIIEVDNSHTYINFNDKLQQVVLLPNSILRVIDQYNIGNICVVLCRLIRTPTIKMNTLLYNKLINPQQANAGINKYVSYRIKTNNNIMPVCAFMLSKFWETNKERQANENLEVYKIRRGRLNNKFINNTSISSKGLQETYAYFSLGQEYELYVDRGLDVMLGSFEDIKYSIHQHFIKDCYKAMDIPCLDYIFIHATFTYNAVSTGILLDDYKNNRKPQYKYNINNFLIDCIFKFNSIKKENKELNIIDADVFAEDTYADKIEGFRDACLYCNGSINPLFNKDANVGEHIQYIRDWKHLFTKYEIASNDDLTKHFKWCNNRLVKLIEVIKATKEHYLKFINETLEGEIKDKNIDTKGVVELNDMLEQLSSILIKRATFYKNCTSSSGVQSFIDIIKVILSDTRINIHNSKLYKKPILEELIMENSISGGLLSMKDINKLNTRIKSDSSSGSKKIDHLKLFEAFKNIPIDGSKDMRKYKAMPKPFKEYYKGAKINKDGYFDISDGCSFRFI